MSGTTKTALGLLCNSGQLPFSIENFLGDDDRLFLLEVCEYAQKMSRVSISRITKTQHCSNMPALTGVHWEMQSFLSNLLKLSLMPKSNTFYTFEQGATFHMRTLPTNNDVSVYCFLESEELDESWSLLVSTPVSEGEHSSKDFPGGLLCDDVLISNVLNGHKFCKFYPKPGDAVIFSGSNCFHYFEEKSPKFLKMISLNFSLVEG